MAPSLLSGAEGGGIWVPSLGPTPAAAFAEDGGVSAFAVAFAGGGVAAFAGALAAFGEGGVAAFAGALVAFGEGGVSAFAGAFAGALDTFVP